MQPMGHVQVLSCARCPVKRRMKKKEEKRELMLTIESQTFPSLGSREPD
jgi:hypothetical protein